MVPSRRGTQIGQTPPNFFFSYTGNVFRCELKHKDDSLILNLTQFCRKSTTMIVFSLLAGSKIAIHSVSGTSLTEHDRSICPLKAGARDVPGGL